MILFCFRHGRCPFVFSKYLICFMKMTEKYSKTIGFRFCLCARLHQAYEFRELLHRLNSQKGSNFVYHLHWRCHNFQSSGFITLVTQGTVTWLLSTQADDPGRLARRPDAGRLCYAGSQPLSVLRIAGGFCRKHWGRATHICVGNLTIIGSNNGLSPGWHQAII